MAEDISVGHAPCAHNGGSYLTKANAVPPACAMERKCFGKTVTVGPGSLHDKSRAIKMAWR